MRPLGLRRRVALTFALGSLVISVALATLTYGLARSYLVRQRERSVTEQTFANARLLRARLAVADPDVPELLDAVGPSGPSHPVLHYRGAWYAGSLAYGRDVLPGALRTLALGGDASRQRYRHADEAHIAVAVPLPSVDGTYFEIFVLAELTRTLDVLRNSLALASFATTLAGAFVGRWAVRRLMEPVTAVSDAAATVASGDLSARLDPGGDPDLAVVAASFNQMTDALEARIARDARFASAVSHELRSPLTTLQNSIEVLAARRADLPDRSALALDLVAAEVDRFARLVEDLLEISRADAGATEEPTEYVRLAEFVVHALRDIDRDVPIEISAEAFDVEVVADKRRLGRVLANLVENAEHHGGGARRVAIRCVDGRVQLLVDDDGPGIPVAERERVFERFFRGTAAGRRATGDGTGLGLALVAEHVRLHRGRVWFDDAPGGGARAVVELPVAR